MNVDFRSGQWLNAPATSEVSEHSLTITTDQSTDFWRETHYGFTRDTGHFLGVATGDGFTATLRIQGEFRYLYDQAGLMVRIDEKLWLKTGVEFTDGEAFLSTVVTNGKSDWSVSQPFKELEDFYIRVTLSNGLPRRTLLATTTAGTVPFREYLPGRAYGLYARAQQACCPVLGV